MLDRLFYRLNELAKDAENRNSITQECVKLLSNKIPKEDHYSKIEKFNVNSNIERYALRNDDDQLGIVIDFELSSSKYCPQIKIPKISDNSSFSGVMTVERLDKNGNLMNVYDVVRIDNGKVTDIFCADPNPTIDNSRIAEIYNDFLKEKSPAKSSSFAENIRVTRENSKSNTHKRKME